MANNENGNALTFGSFGSFPGGQLDNASRRLAQADSLDALQNCPTRRIIDNDDWIGEPSRYQQFAVGQYYLPPVPESGPRKIAAPPSDSSSMALASTVVPSSYEPSLISSRGNSRSAYSISTSRGGSALNHNLKLLEEGDDGALQVPQTGQWQCPFWFVKCVEVLEDFPAWEAHCIYHFREMRHLPKSWRCPFGCSWYTEAVSGSEAWQRQRAHIFTDHPNGGSIDTATKPDTKLIEHLWRIRSITSVEEKDLRSKGVLGDRAYMQTEDDGRNRRLARRPGQGRSRGN